MHDPEPEIATRRHLWTKRASAFRHWGRSSCPY